MKRTLLGLLLLSTTFGLFAAERPKVLARIPFEMVGTYVVLKVRINDNPPLNLLLDSGIGTTLITELSESDSIELERTYKTVLKGLGSGIDMQAWVSDGNQLKIGKYQLKNQTIMILETDVFNLSKHTGSKLNGILGADFFENQVIRIDYTNKCIYMYESSGFVPPKDFHKVPIWLEGHKMFMEVPIQDATGKIRTVRMLIDTGAELTAWFRSYGSDPVPVPEKKIRGYIGRGLSGDIEGSLGILDKVWFSDFQLSDPVVSFPDSLAIAGTNTNTQRDGTIGSQLLSRFDLIVDQQGGFLYVKPNYLAKKPFSYNMAGIEVIQNRLGFQLPEVLNVWNNSPGQEAGVQPGDCILEINGISGFKTSINEIRHVFESRSKSTVELILLRDGKQVHARVRLRNLLEASNQPTDRNAAPAWQPDLGNGRYKNPVLYADYSDPDVIRVGDDFYLTASSFTYMPTLPILHSKDLVNWSIIGHVADGLPLERYKKPVHGEGTWAPALRYHDGKFFIYVCSPNDGLWCATAGSPEGPWKIRLMEAVGKWEDPCPFWDEDGKAYLVRSRVGAGQLVLHRMSADGKKLLDNGKIIVEDAKNLPVLEGPKLYKKDGWYYILAPIGGVSTGQQVALRSRNIEGPYEWKQVLHQGKTAINGPHQGGLVETQTGEWWFMHFQSSPPYGRIVHLQPVQWKEDWPMMGSIRENDSIGEPVSEFRKPNVGSNYTYLNPQTSDEFDTRKLGLQWQWNANVHPSWFSLKANRGSMRLYAVKNLTRGGNLLYAPNLLLQKFPAPSFSATTKVRFQPEKENERAGLVVFGNQWFWLALEKSAEGMRLNLYSGADHKQLDNIKLEQSLPYDGNECFMKVQVTQGGLCTFSYSSDGTNYITIGKPFQAVEGTWVGAKVGIVCQNPNMQVSKGFADFEWFEILY